MSLLGKLRLTFKEAFRFILTCKFYSDELYLDIDMLSSCEPSFYQLLLDIHVAVSFVSILMAPTDRAFERAAN